MVDKKKVVVILPAYNAERTLERTYAEIPKDIVDCVILTDDCSSDRTLQIAQQLGIDYVLKHQENKGYGANQKTCYNKAIEVGGEIIVMLHPDYQYTPKLIKPMIHVVSSGVYDVVLGSRILGNKALQGGMPFYKYISNRFLTCVQNILLSTKLSEYHTGFRAFSKDVLNEIDYNSNSDGFIFDNEILAQVIYSDFNIGEVSCPTHYSDDSSSINLKNSLIYGLGVLRVSVQFFISKKFGIRLKSSIFRVKN